MDFRKSDVFILVGLVLAVAAAGDSARHNPGYGVGFLVFLVSFAYGSCLTPQFFPVWLPTPEKSATRQHEFQSPGFPAQTAGLRVVRPSERTLAGERVPK